MKKYLSGLTVILMMTACMSQRRDHNIYVVTAGQDDTAYLQNVSGCPKVHIRNNDVLVVQSAEYKDIFEIKAVGYEGFCYFNEKVGKDRAVIKPKFKIKRLNPSDIDDVQFSYYLETVEGPKNFLGQKTYFASLNIPQSVEEIFYVADGGELSIPQPGTYDLDIYLGLKVNPYDSEHK